MDNLRLRLLMERAMNGQLDASEQEELSLLITDPANQVQLNRILAESWEEYVPGTPALSEKVQTGMLERILVSDASADNTRKLGYKRWFPQMLAASVILLTSFAVFFIGHKTNPVDKTSAHVQVIVPGGNKAMLTLADGSTIILDEVNEGLIARDKNAAIRKGKGGHLIYELFSDASKAHVDAAEQAFHTISTPNGGTYEVVLPDGTKVFLNSASSLKYPTVFRVDKRVVELQGEAYFEVSKVAGKKRDGARLPFIVKTVQQQIEVLGTHFNVNAYKDGRYVKTTLLEGSVRVVRDGDSNQKSVQVAILKPGQESVNDLGSKNLSIVNANISRVMAWKNGYFIFDNDNIRDVMGQISRWYNIEVSFEGNVSDKKIGGVFQRSKSIYQLMNTLEQTGGIHFKVEGRRVVVIAK